MPTSNNIHIAKFKSKAKLLHKAVKSSDKAALQRITPYFENVSEFKLTQAQLVIARELHFSSWRELVSNEAWIHCSFCKKCQYEVMKIIAGPDAYVCDECIKLCSEIIRS